MTTGSFSESSTVPATDLPGAVTRPSGSGPRARPVVSRDHQPHRNPSGPPPVPDVTTTVAAMDPTLSDPTVPGFRVEDERHEQYCPMCDQRTDAEVCPEHGINTVPFAIFNQGGHRAVRPGMIIAGAYRIERVLGQGGMATVYEATQLSVNRKVAIKFCEAKPSLNGDGLKRSDSRGGPAGAVRQNYSPSFGRLDRADLQRFYRESCLASRVNHPNVVSIFEFGVDSKLGLPFMAMARVEGETLQRVLKREGPLSVGRALNIASQLARALGAAHAEGLVHRDLKPGNVMLTQRPDGVEYVTLLDFGIALPLETATRHLTSPGVTVGTPRYMSPEQVRGRPLDGRSDLYALGCLLHEMLVGAPPWPSIESMVRMLIEPVPVAPRLSGTLGLPRKLLRELKDLHRALLEIRADDRPASANEVFATLESLQMRAARTLQ